MITYTTDLEFEDFISGLADGLGGYQFGTSPRVEWRFKKWPPQRIIPYETGFKRGKEQARLIRKEGRAGG